MPATLRFALALIAAATLGGCITSDDAGPPDGGDAVQPFPTNYRSEIPAFIRSYLNNPVGLRDAAMAEPVQRQVAGRVRFVSCLRFTPQGGRPQELAIVHVNGRVDRVAGNAQELCAAAVYAPFPELEKIVAVARTKSSFAATNHRAGVSSNLLRRCHSPARTLLQPRRRATKLTPSCFEHIGRHRTRDTMKKILLSAAAICALTAPAVAADLGPRTYTKAPPAYTAPEVVYNWTGFYIGGNVGGAFAGSNNIQSDAGRFMGGVQGGFDYQFAPNWVAGVEAQYSWMAASNTGVIFPGGSTATENTRGLGSVTGRLGYTWGPALLYAKGGYAFRDSTLGVNTAGGIQSPYTTSGNRNDGYTVGAGLEYMFAPSWSAKVEYQYYKFGDTNFTGGPADVVGTSFRNDDHTVKAGINYRFGWGGPAVAKY